MEKTNMTPQQHPKLTIKQDGKVYDLYNLPKGFVIKGDVDLSRKYLTELPDLSTVVVMGNFTCGGNNLKNLKGAPKEVKGSFYCSYNKLTSLKGAPKHVGGSFFCSGNRLQLNLKGAPKKVGGDFDCSHNLLISLSGAPQNISGNFNCSYNHLQFLNGAPQTVGGDFNCSYNQLQFLNGSPREVCGSFYCSDNFLESLSGAPEKCCSDETGCYNLVFSFVRNNVTSLQYLPKIPKNWRMAQWFCHENPLKVDDNIPDYVLENIHSLCGISKELKEQLVLKRRAQKLQLAQEKQRMHILHRNASRQR